MTRDPAALEVDMEALPNTTTMPPNETVVGDGVCAAFDVSLRRRVSELLQATQSCAHLVSEKTWPRNSAALGSHTSSANMVASRGGTSTSVEAAV